MFSKIFLKNNLNLLIFQFVNILIPLVIFPYCINIYGSNDYGIILFYQSIFALFSVIADYAQDSVGIKILEDFGNVNNSLINSFMVRVFALIISFILGFILLFFLLDEFDITLAIFSSWPCLFFVFFPQYIFLIKEKILQLALFNAVLKILILFSILLFVNQNSELFILPMIYFILTIIVGIFSLKNLLSNSFKLKNLNINFLKIIFKKSFIPFLVNIVTSFYKNAHKIIIGKLISYEAVTVFEGIDKIINLLKLPSKIVNTSVMNSKSLRDSLNLKPIYLVLIINIISIAFVLMAIDLISSFLNLNFNNYITEIIVYSLSIFFISISSYLGLYQFLYKNLQLKYFIASFIGLGAYVVVVYIGKPVLFTIVLAILIAEFLNFLYTVLNVFTSKSS